MVQRSFLKKSPTAKEGEIGRRGGPYQQVSAKTWARTQKAWRLSLKQSRLEVGSINTLQDVDKQNLYRLELRDDQSLSTLIVALRARMMK